MLQSRYDNNAMKGGKIMPVIHLKTLELDDTKVIVKPLVSDIAVEKKYDRHGFGEVIAGGENLESYYSRKVVPGDYVVYDDSDTIEIQLEVKEGEPPISVEVVDKYDICGVDFVATSKKGKK